MMKKLPPSHTPKGLPETSPMKNAKPGEMMAVLLGIDQALESQKQRTLLQGRDELDMDLKRIFSDNPDKT